MSVQRFRPGLLLTLDLISRDLLQRLELAALHHLKLPVVDGMVAVALALRSLADAVAASVNWLLPEALPRVYPLNPSVSDTASLDPVYIQRLLNRIHANLAATSPSALLTAKLSLLSDNRGLAARMLQLNLQWDPTKTISAPSPSSSVAPSTDTATAPSTEVAWPSRLLCKISARSLVARRAVRLAGHGREGLFLDSPTAERLRAALGPAALPDVVLAYGSNFLGEFSLLMADIRQRPGGAVGANLLLGNQTWGIPTEIPAHLKAEPLAVMRSAMALAAHMHAEFWNDTSLLQQPYLKAVPYYHGYGRAGWEAAVAATQKYWQRALRHWDQPSLGVKIKDTVRELVTNSLAKASWSALQQRLHSKDHVFTLTHGDFHAANMLWMAATSSSPRPNNEGQLVMVDWSEVGVWEPTTDLGQTMISDLKPEFTRQHALPLIHHYWETLTNLRPELRHTFPFERCWQDFCRSTVERWVFFFALLAGWNPNLPAPLIQWFHDNLESFVQTFYDDKRVCTMSSLVYVTYA